MTSALKVALSTLVTSIILLSVGFIYLQTEGSGITSPLAGTRAPTVTTDPNTGDKVVFKNYGPAPEFKNVQWLNGDPQTITALKGKVVLINFWTFSCIACIHQIPQINQWADAYKDQGLAIISIHTPEYAFEKVADNVQNAIQRYHPQYPIAQDNGYTMWNAYNNQFWPALYLIDKEGKIVYARLGEGHYDLTDNAIQQLVALPGGLAISSDPQEDLAKTPSRTMQFGVKHADVLASNEKPATQEQVYTLPEKLRSNALALEGIWKLGDNQADLTQGYGRIRLNFNAATVKLSAQSIKPVAVKILVDGKLRPNLDIQTLQDYTLFEADKAGRHTLEIQIPQPGFEARTFILE